MNNLIKYGLCALVSLNAVSCVRDFSKDYQLKGKYNGYDVISKRDGMGYSVAICDSASMPIIRADNIRPYEGLPEYDVVTIKSYGAVSRDLEHYVNLDSLKKIDNYLRNKNGIK